MAQATNLTSGVPQAPPFDTNDLVALLLALVTEHSGAARPAVITADGSGRWTKVVSATAWELYYYDGTQDVLIGTINPTDHTWTPAGLVVTGRGVGEKLFFAVSCR